MTVIRTLLDACPEAILEADFCGDLPLYMLFGAQIDHSVLQHILEKDPSLALFSEKRFSGSQTLLQTICAQWVVQVRNRERRANDNMQKKQNNQTVVPRSRLLLDSELLNRWRKLVLMVRAAHRATSTIDATIDRSSSSNSSNATTATIQDSDEIPELHLALQLGSCLPRAVIAQFIEVYPEQAAKAVLGKRTTLDDSSLSCPRKLQHHRSLPLHLAISTQRLSWNDGLKALVYAHPTALFQEDCKKLVPFLQQATTAANSDDEKDSWNTVYCLLREDPSVLSRILAR